LVAKLEVIRIAYTDSHTSKKCDISEFFMHQFCNGNDMER